MKNIGFEPDLHWPSLWFAAGTEATVCVTLWRSRAGQCAVNRGETMSLQERKPVRTPTSLPLLNTLTETVECFDRCSTEQSVQNSEDAERLGGSTLHQQRLNPQRDHETDHDTDQSFKRITTNHLA